MNFLGHLYFAQGHKGLTLGGFLADFVKGPLKGTYPKDIELGMRLHRKIDVWSDQHRSITACRQLLPPEFARYTGIIVDLLSDHFLSCKWQQYSSEPLSQFTQRKIHILASQTSLYPEKAVRTLNRMREGDWLNNYHRLDYCLGALTRIGKRFKRANPLHLLETPVIENYDALEYLCSDILSDLSINVAEWRSENIDRKK